MFSQRLSLCPSARPSGMGPVSEVQISSSMSVALNIYAFIIISSHQARVALSGRIHLRLRKQLLFSMIAIVSSIPRLPPNRANGETVFEGSPIRYNTASFGSKS